MDERFTIKAATHPPMTLKEFKRMIKKQNKKSDERFNELIRKLWKHS